VGKGTFPTELPSLPKKTLVEVHEEALVGGADVGVALGGGGYVGGVEKIAREIVKSIEK
jgi:hypothetical protein